MGKYISRYIYKSWPLFNKVIAVRCSLFNTYTHQPRMCQFQSMVRIVIQWFSTHLLCDHLFRQRDHLNTGTCLKLLKKDTLQSMGTIFQEQNAFSGFQLITHWKNKDLIKVAVHVFEFKMIGFCRKPDIFLPWPKGRKPHVWMKTRRNITKLIHQLAERYAYLKACQPLGPLAQW